MNTIDTAAAALEAAKIAEAAATSARIDAEHAVLALVAAKDEGSVTVRGLHYKATVTFGVNRTLDAPALSAVRESLPADLFDQAFEYRPAIRLAGLRYLQQNEPEAYAIAAQAVTAKPAKPSVKVEAIRAESDDARLAA